MVGFTGGGISVLVGVGVEVGVEVSVGVGVAVRVRVRVGVGEFVWLALGMMVKVGVHVAVLVDVGDGVGVGPMRDRVFIKSIIAKRINVIPTVPRLRLFLRLDGFDIHVMNRRNNSPSLSSSDGFSLAGLTSS